MRSFLLLTVAVISLSACNRGGENANAVLNEANASGAEASPKAATTAAANFLAVFIETIPSLARRWRSARLRRRGESFSSRPAMKRR